MCEDVINIAREYSTQLIYTLGAFYTDRKYGKSPNTFFVATTQELATQIQCLRLEPTPGSSLITGFNGLVFGFAKQAGLQRIGLFAEINDPQLPQFRAAKNILATLEKLAYQKFRSLEELDEMASRLESEESGKF